MRGPIIAGNWKMNKTVRQAVELVEEIKPMVSDVREVEIVVCPPFTALEAVSKVLPGTNIALGAQDMHWELEGAFTGEISSEMILTVGGKYVILGHSERRTYFGETNETVNKKVLSALQCGLKPIICVGETLQQREAGTTKDVVRDHVDGALKGLSAGDVPQIVLAYEPVWAIGTGLTATPAQAEEVHAFIRELLTDLYDGTLAQKIRIQYGGSVKPENAAQLFGQPNIDGGLIGGASLEADSFAAIVKSAR